MTRTEAYRNQNHGRTGSQSFVDKGIPFNAVDDSPTPLLDETGGRVNDYLDSDMDFTYDKITQTESVINVESQNEHISKTLDVSDRDSNDDEIPSTSINLNSNSILITSPNDITINAGNLTDNHKKVNITAYTAEANNITADTITVDKTDGKTVIDSTGVKTNELITYGDAHIKGNLYVDGSGIETISTELKVGSDIIEIRNGNTAPIQDYAGIVINNYDGVHNSGLMEDNTGTVMVGNITTTSTVIYTEDGSTFYTDVELTTAYTPDPLDKLRNTQNFVPDTDIQIWEAYQITSSDMVPLAGRDTEANMADNKIVKWDANNKIVKTTAYSTDDFVQQVYEMPDPTSDEYIGKSVVYIGDTDANYTNGCLYVSSATTANPLDYMVVDGVRYDSTMNVATIPQDYAKRKQRQITLVKPAILTLGTRYFVFNGGSTWYSIEANLTGGTSKEFFDEINQFEAYLNPKIYRLGGALTFEYQNSNGNYWGKTIKSVNLNTGAFELPTDVFPLSSGFSGEYLADVTTTQIGEPDPIIGTTKYRYTFNALVHNTELLYDVGTRYEKVASFNYSTINTDNTQYVSKANGAVTNVIGYIEQWAEGVFAWKAQTVPISEVANLVYPVGSWYYTQDANFNPNTQWLGQTWVKVYDKQADIAREDVYWKTMNNFPDASSYNKMFYSGSPSVVLGDPDDTLDYEGKYTDHNHPEVIGTVIGTNWMKAGQVCYHYHRVPQHQTVAVGQSGDGTHGHYVRTFTSTGNDSNYGVNEGNGKGLPLTTGSNYAYYNSTNDGYSIVETAGGHRHTIPQRDTSGQWTTQQGNAWSDDDDVYYYDDEEISFVSGTGDSSKQTSLEPLRTKRMVVYAWRRTA